MDDVAHATHHLLESLRRLPAAGIAKTKQQKHGHTRRNVLVRSSLTRGSDIRIDRAMLRTPLCELVGIEHPIIVLAMGLCISPGPSWSARGHGGLGILQAQTCATPIPAGTSTRSRTHRQTVRCNFISHFPIDEQVAVVSQRVPIVSFLGPSDACTVELRACRRRETFSIKSVRSRGAQRAAKANVDVIIAQGRGRRSHCRRSIDARVVLRVVDAVTPCPVAAAGGNRDWSGGIRGASVGRTSRRIGTRFLASVEARAHPDYKREIGRLAGENEICPHNAVWFWLAECAASHMAHAIRRGLAGQKASARPGVWTAATTYTVIAGQQIPLQRFMGFPPNCRCNR